MIIFLIVLGIMVVSFIACAICSKKCDVFSDVPYIFGVIGTIFAVRVIIMAIVVGIVHSPRYQERRLRECQLRREAIVWQIEHDLYVGGILDEYNAEVYRAQYNHENPWTNWFYGDYYMELELIDTGEVSQK